MIAVRGRFVRRFFELAPRTSVRTTFLWPALLASVLLAVPIGSARADETAGDADSLIAQWIRASESLAGAVGGEASPSAVAHAESLLVALRIACLSTLEDDVSGDRGRIDRELGPRLAVRATSDTEGSVPERLLPEIESGLARCALLRDDLPAVWHHLEKSRDFRTDPVSLEEMQSVLYGSEAALLLYDGGAHGDPVALWITATQARGTILPARSEMMRSANAARMPTADSDFASRFLPDRPREDTVRRIYVAPPLGLESYPFDFLDQPVSYTPTGSMLRDRSSPRLWSGTKLVVLTGGDGARAASSPSRSSTQSSSAESDRDEEASPRAYEIARAAVRGAAIVHEHASALQLRQVAHDEPIVLHLDLIAAHHPEAPERSAILCTESDSVPAAEIAELDLAADLVVIEAADRAMSFALGRGGLADAFLSAGARSVVIPRWKVDARVAERFHAELYTQLHRSLPRDEAFRNAQEALLEAGTDPRDVYAFAHWGAGNVPVYVLSRKDSVVPLLLGWLTFLPPVVFVVAYLRRRYLRNARLRTDDD